MSVFLLMEWLNSGSNLKSVGETDRLINGVLRHPEFKASDFEGFTTHRENQRLDKADADAVGTPFQVMVGAHQSSISLCQLDKRTLPEPVTHSQYKDCTIGRSWGS